MLSESDQLLVRAAREAAERAYAPYSMCFTGAAVRSIRELIYVGASLESASYGLTLCAEMNALAAANQSRDRATKGGRNCPGEFERSGTRRGLDGRRRDHESRTEHGWRIDLERCETSGRIETKCLAAVGICLGSASESRQSHFSCPREGLARSHPTDGARSRSRHVYDQPCLADYGRSAVK